MDAIRHKNNFKGTDYDLDVKMTAFLKERSEKVAEKILLRKA